MDADIKVSKYLMGCVHKKMRTSDELIGVLACAQKIVAFTIVNALKEIGKTDDCATNNDCPGCKQKDLHGDPQNDWPTSEKMSVRDGLRIVKKMMKEWKAERAMRGWKFYAEFIGLESDGSSDFYNYQVRWSVPTAAYPEPRVTVSVFFTVKASRTNNCPIRVTYVFEGKEFAHCPKMPFRPKWIYDVLDTKTMVFESFDFQRDPRPRSPQIMANKPPR